MTSSTRSSEALFQRGLKVLVEGVSSSSRGPATFGTHPRYMSHGSGADGQIGPKAVRVLLDDWRGGTDIHARMFY